MTFADDGRDESQDEQVPEEAPEETPDTPEAEEPTADGGGCWPRRRRRRRGGASEEPASEEPPAEAPAAEEKAEEPPAEEPAAEEKAEEAPAEEPAAEEKAQEPAADSAADEAPKERPKRERKTAADKSEPEVIPGAHLEPDLVLEDEGGAGAGVGEQTAAEIQAAEEALAAEDGSGGESEEGGEPEPVPATVLDLAADARYQATGKRKRAVARVILKPGSGNYTVNGRQLDEFFPRGTLQRTARGPLETAGQQERMDVVAKIHGGGVSSQAGALRHGIARALVEADPALRGELKRRGFLTRDPRVKERKKAGLKKARKRPQFSKR